MNILVIQLRRIGDILLTTPVLSYLKHVFPDSYIDFLAEPCGQSVLETNPRLRELLIYNSKEPLNEIRRVRSRRYDLVLDFMNNPRSTYLTALSGATWRVGFNTGLRSLLYNVRVPVPLEPEYVPLRKLRMVKHWLVKSGWPAPTEQSFRPEFYLTDEDERFADAWQARENITMSSAVIMAPVHRHKIRQWRLDGFKQVALSLTRELGTPVFFAWGPGEEGVLNDLRRGHESMLRLLPPTSVRQMAALFKRARLVVTNDSGAMHTAVAVKTPTVTIYGPTRPIDWNPSLAPRPSGQDMAVTADGVSCLGCHRGSCPVGHVCMENLGDVTVLAACEKILKESRYAER